MNRFLVVVCLFVPLIAGGCAGHTPSPSTKPTHATASLTTITATVHIRVSGISLLVDPATSSDPYAIVVLNARDISHTPTITVATANMANSALSNVFTLTGQELIVDDQWSSSNPSLTFSTAGDSSDARCPSTSAPVDSLHWLPRLSRVLDLPSTVTLKSAYQSANPSSTLVSARMPLPGGTLASEFASFPNQPVWQFLNASDVVLHEQAVADGVDYSFDVTLDATTPVYALKVRDFGSTSTSTLVSLVPSSGRIDLALYNVPDHPAGAPSHGYQEPHFAKYLSVYDNIGTYEQQFDAYCQSGAANSTGTACGPDRVP